MASPTGSMRFLPPVMNGSNVHTTISMRKIISPTNMQPCGMNSGVRDMLAERTSPVNE